MTEKGQTWIYKDLSDFHSRYKEVFRMNVRPRDRVIFENHAYDFVWLKTTAENTFMVLRGIYDDKIKEVPFPDK